MKSVSEYIAGYEFQHARTEEQRLRVSKKVDLMISRIRDSINKVLEETRRESRLLEQVEFVLRWKKADMWKYYLQERGL